jgi:hypothetical protein
MVLTKMKHHFYFSFFVVLLLAQSMFFLGIKYSFGADFVQGGEIFSIRWIGSESIDTNGVIILQAQTSKKAQSLSFEITKDDHTLSSGLLSATSMSLEESTIRYLPVANTNWHRIYYFPDTWPNGNYTIYIRAIPLDTPEGDETLLVEKFVLDRAATFEVSWQGAYTQNSLENESHVALLVANTSVAAEQLSFKITKDDLTLSSGLLRASTIGDRKRWYFNFIFPDAWPDGNYNISIQANPLGSIASNSSVTIVQPYILNRLAIGDQFIGGESIFTYDTEMSGTEILELKTINWSQADFNSFQVKFKLYSGTMVVAEPNAIKSPFSADNQKITANFNTDLTANGNYKICAHLLFNKVEKYVKCGPQVEIFNTENVSTRSLKLYLEIGTTVRTGDRIYASANFTAQPSTFPTLSIKTAKNSMSVLVVNPAPYFVTMSSISCHHNSIPVAMREAIAQSGHTHCWQAQIPAENTSLAFTSGSGSILVKYGPASSEIVRTSLALSSTIVENNVVATSTAPVERVPEQELGLSDATNTPQNTDTQLVELEPSKDLVSFGTKVSCVDSAVYDEANCQEFLATLGGQINPQCLGAGIYNDQACENYLLQEQLKNECDEQGILNTKACQDLLLEKYFSTIECRMDDEELCFRILREKYLNRLLVAKNQQTKISSTTESLIGQVWALDALSAKLVENKIDVGILPLLADKETKVLLAKSSQRTILESSEQLTILQDVVMIVDNDADGLSNDMEKYYGTDVNNPNTDGDAYSDGEEVASGSNPLGEGALLKDRSNLDKIISSGSSLEQPTKLSQKIDENFKVTFSRNENNMVRLAGVAEANTWLNIFLYSDLPLVMTTKTDASGNWTYDVQNSLVDGGHQVYVTVNDDTGSMVKQSNPVSFLVKSAQAVTVGQYFDNSKDLETVTDSMLWVYIVAVAILIIIGIIFIFVLYRNKKSHLEN